MHSGKPFRVLLLVLLFTLAVAATAVYGSGENGQPSPSLAHTEFALKEPARPYGPTVWTPSTEELEPPTSDSPTETLAPDRLSELPHPGTSPDNSLATDRQALNALYNATGGDNWTNNTGWLTDAPLGQWYGVRTDAGGRVIGLGLTDNNLAGELPPELGNLTNLWTLYLHTNQLTGEIPAELGNLTNLRSLHLSANQLTGEIPAELGNLANLRLLSIGKNQLTGEIPTWLGNLAVLVDLSLYNNQLTGEIPSELGNLANLRTLWLFDNELTGEIPAELGNLANLMTLWLSDNELTGEIPPELGNLTNLQKLLLSYTQLTGEIPPELGNLTNLTDLGLRNNQLTGEIPPELGNLANLRTLYLGGNQLTGEIPPELGNFANLTDLSLNDNQLTGEIPPELGNLANLRSLYLGGNQLTGCVPAALRYLVAANLHNDLEWLGLPFCDATPPPPAGSASKIYWTAAYWIEGVLIEGKIQRANPDGSQMEDLVTGLDYPYGLALDVAAGKMYWSTSLPDGTAIIQRANLDGSQVEDLVPALGLDIALDVAAGKVYWTKAGQQGKIQRANLDGSQVEDLVTLELGKAYGIALDVAAGKVYWTEVYWTEAGQLRESKIQRANLDGSQVEDLLVEDSFINDIALDVAAGKMYWPSTTMVTESVYTDKIQRANLDGTQVEEIGVIPVNGIALDVVAGKIYWAHHVFEKIQRANLDGSQVEDLFTVLGNPGRLALDLSGTPSTPPPTTNPCVEDLGSLTATIVRQGTWTGECDSANKAGRYARFYTFTLGQRSEATVSLESSQDTVVNLLQGAGTDGRVIANSDDVDSGNNNSRITTSLGPGSYTVEATTFAGGIAGDFTLTLAPERAPGGFVPPPAPASCVVELGTLGASVEQQGSWTSACGSQKEPDTYARFYDFTLSQETEVTLELESSLDTVLYLDGLGTAGGFNAINDDVKDGSGSRDSRIVRTLPAGPYRIEAATYVQERTGSFTLRILLPGSEPEPDPVDVVDRYDKDNDGVISISELFDAIDDYFDNLTIISQLFDVIDAYFAGGTGTPQPQPDPEDCTLDLGTLRATRDLASEWASGCDSVSRDGSYAQYYSFHLSERRSVRIETNSNTNTVLYLLRGDGIPTNDSEYDVITHNDDIEPGVNTNSRIIRTLDSGTYTVEATTYDAGATGIFSLHLSTSDRHVLTALYNATDGDNWRRNDNWLTDVPIEFWDGVDTSGDGIVTKLELRSNGLDGVIPPAYTPDSLGDLRDLVVLDLRDNQLTGRIPEDLGQLENLKTLRLNHNQLSGPIPEELGQLENLEVLTLNHNLLDSTIPDDLSNLPEGGSLAKLRWLNLEHNLLTGTIPGSLGTLSNLEALSLGHNRLNGRIPDELSNFPEEGGQLSNLRLLYLNAQSPYRGGVQGPFPDNDQYWLGGDIPVWISSLTNLEELHLGDNRLTGGMHYSWGGLSKLRKLVLKDNRMEDGQITSPAWNLLTDLEELDLRGNGFSGTIPVSLAQLENLNTLRLSGNEFTGCIPYETDGHYVDWLSESVPNNDLDQLGLELCSGPETDRQALLGFYSGMGGSDWENGGQGDDEEWKGELFRAPDGRAGRSNWYGVHLDEDNRVISIWLTNNGLVDHLAEGGQGRSALENLQPLDKLQDLQLDDNNLYGSIPESLGKLSNLRTLGLEENNLYGRIPESLGNLSNLSLLDLNNNNLSGPIPSTLSGLHLHQLWLSGNELSGCIPNALFGVDHNDLRDLARGQDLISCAPARDVDFNVLKELYETTGGPDWRKGGRGHEQEWLIGNIENWYGVAIATEGDGYHPRGDECKGRVIALILNSNKLTGLIPESLGSLDCLLRLELNGNNLSGPIPYKLGDLKSFKGTDDGQGPCADSNYYVYVNVPFDAEASYRMGQRILRLGNNRLSYEIPASLGNLKCMTQLDLSRNHRQGITTGLKGGIPESFKNLTELIFLDLSGNLLSFGVDYAFPQSEISQGDWGLYLNLAGNPWRPEYKGAFDDFQQTTVGFGIDQLKGSVQDTVLGEAREIARLTAKRGSNRAVVAVAKRAAKIIPAIGQAITVYEFFQFVIPGGGKGSVPCGLLSCQDWYTIFVATSQFGGGIVSEVMQNVDPIICHTSVEPWTLDGNSCPRQDED